MSFQFTTERVINSLAGISVIDNTSTLADPGVPAGSKALYVKTLNKFVDKNTPTVYKNVGYAAVKEVATITIPAGTYAAGVYRLELDVLMSGAYPITYDRWAINKGKPFYVEVLMPATGTATAFATAFVAGVKKGLTKINGDVIKDIAVSNTAGVISITAGNEYQRFKYSAVTLLDAEGEDFDPIVTGVIATPGKEGFGTSWWLTKNVRLPTQEATRFMGEDQDERPTVGSIYNQYVLKYAAQRNIGSLDYVGGLGVSHTDHIFWVPQTLATAFEGLITSAFGADKLVVAF